MTFTATVDSAGTHTNVAEVTEADQPDTDSTPGNGCEGAAGREDDCADATVIADESGVGSLTLRQDQHPDRHPGRLPRRPATRAPSPTR